MAQASSISSIMSQKNPDGSPYEPISKVSGLGGLVGMIAALIGLLMSNGVPLVPIPSIGALIMKTPAWYWASAIFMLVLAAGLLIQAIGSKKLRDYLGSGLTSIVFIAVILAVLTGVILIYGGLEWNLSRRVVDFMVHTATITAFFVIAWQIYSVVFVDASKNMIGLLAGILNGFFIPILAIGQVLGPAVVTAAYLVLLLGQLFTWLFFWSPMTTVREYARSTDTAKFGFGLAGFLTFLLGSITVFVGPLVTRQGVQIWTPWSTMADATTFVTDPVLVYSLLASLLFWVMLAPRLGARELKITAIGEDIVKGGIKYFMLFLAMVGIFAAGQAGTMVDGPLHIASSVALFLSVAPAAIIIMMGSVYAGKTDIIVGIPMVVAGVFLLIHPFTLGLLVMIPWILVMITQFILMLETRTRGLTAFSQQNLTVFVTLIASAIFTLFIIGGLGSGPAAIWPVNRWFPLTLFRNIPVAVQTATILALPILALLIRNMALVGYAHGRSTASAGVLGGLTLIFALMIPMIGDPSASLTHQALTAAAVMLAGYALSFVLVLSLNLGLASEVEDTQNPYEGMLVRVVSIAGLAMGVVAGAIIMGTFSGFPSAGEIAIVITLLVTLVVGLEILNLLSWIIIGTRLGMLKKGWKYKPSIEA